MNNFKYLLLFIFLAVAIQITAKSFTIDNIKYEIVKSADEKKYFDNVVRVNDGKKVKGVVAIPSSVVYNSITYYVEGITNSAFENNKEIEEVLIPSSVWLLNINVFRGCSNLRKVTFEDSMSECKFLRISWGAFANCTNLNEMILPNKRSDIFGKSSVSYFMMPFQNCTNIENVVLPDSLIHDSDGNNYFKDAFKGCKKIKSVRRYTKSPVFASTMFDGTCVWINETFPEIKNLNDQQFIAYLGGERFIDNKEFQESPELAVNQATGHDHVSSSASAFTASTRPKAEIKKSGNNKVSEVDNFIPQTNKKNETAFAIILANENYKREESVQCAINDGEIVKSYLINTLGYVQDNVMLQADATLNDFN